ncbi:patatin-like phospholipase family protein [Janthinobacterium sp. 64]|uniref:patatin-like phospholipase family protein n=1 Tax=Janthinobacterium sp. 64 TaxID=2035208 RepID=UPI000C2C1543|nr:patatin-like phospholipase family protein [Janthinobacterium sp. 64]PKB13817.1 NTE family protein [Janthinobacterium sp. 64]
MAEKIALALSGGGVRAMVFHMGVLRFLAERNMLERVAELSTVSGGSLLVGLIFSKSGMRWPTSAEYISLTHPKIKTTLTRNDAQVATIARALLPKNWRFWLARPNILARTFFRDWKVKGTLGDLPYLPIWSINCTTAETGKRFRFKERELGDRVVGYADAAKFPLASAMAISAAFPVGFGPFSLDARRFSWTARPSGLAHSQKNIHPLFKTLHLYDGGVYDNLGLESFYDIGTGKAEGDYRIILSDAGAPLERGFGLWALNPLRVKRLMDVMMDQNRALRVRGFVDYVINSKRAGYLGISRSKNLKKALVREPIGYSWLSDDQAQYVSNFPTSLSQISDEDFGIIERHGYETARLTDSAFPYLQAE